MGDEFHVVHRHRKASKCKKILVNNKIEHFTEDCSTLVKKLEHRKLDLFSSEFSTDFKLTLQKAFTASGIPENPALDIVCYGLGSCSNSVDAIYQLCLLLLLRDYTSSSKVYLYDPIFSQCEVDALRQFNLEILDVNEEGKRAVESKTIFFIPHCSKSLYNNLLWANWSPTSLSHLVIIGNSFSEMGYSLPQRILEERFQCLAHVLPVVSEFLIPNTFRFDTIFNSLSVHTFEEEKLGLLDELVWNMHEQVFYEADDELILSIK